MKEEILKLTTKIYRIVRNYYEQLFDNKSHNLETNKFLETYYLPRLNNEEIGNLGGGGV